MGVTNFGLRLKESAFELGDEGFACLGGLDCCAWMIEELDKAVLPEVGGADLLLAAAGNELRVGIVGKGAVASTARAIGTGDPSKPSEVLLVAGADAVVCHEFEVVGVGTDCEV